MTEGNEWESARHDRREGVGEVKDRTEGKEWEKWKT